MTDILSLGTVWNWALLVNSQDVTSILSVISGAGSGDGVGEGGDEGTEGGGASGPA